MSKYYYTYMATNKYNTTLYTGVTNNLERRSFEHKNKLVNGFTSKYNICKIVWYDVFDSPSEAIHAEKKIKGWTRAKKINLITSANQDFQDLDPSQAQDDRKSSFEIKN